VSGRGDHRIRHRWRLLLAVNVAAFVVLYA
jgi:hypothetical protein